MVFRLILLVCVISLLVACESDPAPDGGVLGDGGANFDSTAPDAGRPDSVGFDGGESDTGDDAQDALQVDAGPEEPVPPLGESEVCDTPRVGEHPCHLSVSYGPAPLNVLDVFLPPDDVARVPGLFLWVHGGGFRSGTRDAGRAHLAEYLPRGIAVASIDYRLSGTNAFTPDSTASPVFMTDSARALQFLRYYADELGYDADKIVMAGNSAGGGISLWLAFHDDLADPTSPDPLERISSRVTCVAPVNGQTSYDMRFIAGLFPGGRVHLHPALFEFYEIAEGGFLPDDPEFNRVYGPLFEEASPLFHLDASDAGAKVCFAYNVPFDSPDIHSPEFGTHAASGTPSVLGYDYATFEDVGVMSVLYDADAPASLVQDQRRLFLEANCF